MINNTILVLTVIFLGLTNFTCHEIRFSEPNKVSVPNDESSAIKKIASLKITRSVHTATLLNDGSVLVAGGMDNSQSPLKSAETFNPESNSFQTISDMKTPRVGHIAVLLKSGNVLIAGGFDSRKPTASAEIFDARTRTFKAVENMKIARGGHVGTLLNDGRVLISGSETGEKEIEIFDEKNGSFSIVGKMSVSRLAHTSTLLNDGKVLIAGGSYDHNLTKNAEIFDPVSNKFSAAEEMPVPRHKHAAILLDNGNVLIVGGSDEKDWNGQYASSVIYESKKGKFRALKNMNVSRFKIASALSRLPDGNILISGANEQAEIFDYKKEAFTLVSGKMDDPRFYTTATILKDGRVLIIGGYNRAIKNNGSVWIYG